MNNLTKVTMKSVFIDKTVEPNNAALKKALKDTFGVWQKLVNFTRETYPDAVEKWHFTSEKYGWSYRVSDKKRVIVYFLPRDKFFKIAFVFGQKATDSILASDISNSIKNEFKAAKVYAEGRGIRISVTDTSQLEDIKKLIVIKIAN